MPVYYVFRQQMVVHLRSLCFSQMVMQRRRLRVFHMFSQCSARPCQIGQPATINKQLNLTPGFPRLFQNSQGDHCWQGDCVSHTTTAEGGLYRRVLSWRFSKSSLSLCSPSTTDRLFNFTLRDQKLL